MQVQDLADTGGQREEKKFEVFAERVMPDSNTAVHGKWPFIIITSQYLQSATCILHPNSI